jgi:uncharacterized protein (TIGR03000 family)
MFRIAIASVTLALFASVAVAQPRPLPLSPGVMRGSPIGPGMPFAPTNPVPPGQQSGQQQNNTGFLPIVPVTYGFYGYGYPYGGYPFGAGYPFNNIQPQNGYTPVPDYIPATGSVPNYYAPAASSAPTRSAGGIYSVPQTETTPAKELSATLTLQLPVAGEVWLNGKKVSSEKSDEQVLTSPVMKPNEQYKFNVKARWTYKGKTYETERAVTLDAGERSRLLVVSGDEVKK